MVAATGSLEAGTRSADSLLGMALSGDVAQARGMHTVTVVGIRDAVAGDLDDLLYLGPNGRDVSRSESAYPLCRPLNARADN